MSQFGDLREKSALDFCSKEEGREWFLEDMELTEDEYIAYCDDDPTFRALGLMDVADYTGNEALMEEVKRAFKEELDHFFEEEAC